MYEVNAQECDGWAPLHFAAWGHVECLQALLEQRANLGILDDQGRTAKDIAILGNKQECEALLETFERVQKEKKLLHSDLEKTSSSDSFKQRKSLSL